jgi:hypothetical protein
MRRSLLRRPPGGAGPMGAAVPGRFLAGVVVLACFSAGLALAGCGNSRTPVPSSVAPAAPNGFRTLTYSAQGMTVAAPRNWSVNTGRPPLVSIVTSGSAVVALWRFPRRAQPPAGRRSLQRTKLELVSEARARDPSLRLIDAPLSAVDGAPAIELDAFERVGGQVRRVRSTHVFAPHAELVLDEYAPPAVFRSVNNAVFAPVKRSLALLHAGS